MPRTAWPDLSDERLLSLSAKRLFGELSSRSLVDEGVVHDEDDERLLAELEGKPGTRE